MKKLLIFGGGGVVVLGAAAIVAFLLLATSIIKQIIEEVGGQATQAKVSLADVSLSLTSGEGALKGLVIGNPKGFKSAQAFKLGEVSLKVDPSSVGKDVIVVKEVVIASPDITYELGDTGSDNIRTIQANAKSFASRFGGGSSAAGKPASQPAPAPSTQPAAKNEKDRKVIIENLYIRGGRVAVTASALGGKPLDTGLPDIHLANIGKASGGATAAEVADQVIGAIAQASQTAVSKIGMDQLKGLAGGKADELMKKLGTQMPQGMPTNLPGLGGGNTAPSQKPADPGGAINRLLGR
jgi:uncharacterized protein involved in outer membrane biogenesis